MNATGLIVMGVAGCGKTTIGMALAARLGWDFFDADEYHPPANVAKMAAGIPLDDGDRVPWLAALHERLIQTLRAGGHPVLACSALKQRYRETLLKGIDGVRVVHLRGSYDLIIARMNDRTDHYMKPGMLRSQFDALEEPQDALTVDITPAAEEIVENILFLLHKEDGNPAPAVRNGRKSADSPRR
ncbi:MAG: gluconokinase [Anaerolineales bacterium]